MRFGVFIDGVWFSNQSRWCSQAAGWRSPLSFRGVHDALRWYLHQHHQRPLADVHRTCSHYVLGRATNPTPGAGEWNRALADAGITCHDAHADPRHERGPGRSATAILARLASSQARTMSLDTVVMLTGNPKSRTVISRLVGGGVTVVVPAVTAAPGRRRITTPDSLMRSATAAPAWDDLLSTAVDPRYPLAYPFTRPARGAVSEPAGDGWRYGTVTRWRNDGPREAHGFLIDRGGLTWHVTGRALPDGISALPAGQPVRFIGNPRYTRGRECPQAYAVSPFQPIGLLPDSS